MVGKAERLLEAPVGNAAMQELLLLSLRLLLGAGNEQAVTFLRQFDFVGSEAGNSHTDAVLVVADFLDVVGRPLGTYGAVEHVEQPVEADGRTIERCEVEGSHNHILLRAT